VAQPDIRKAERNKIIINIFRLSFMLAIHCMFINDHAVRAHVVFKEAFFEFPCAHL